MIEEKVVFIYLFSYIMKTLKVHLNPSSREYIHIRLT